MRREITKDKSELTDNSGNRIVAMSRNKAVSVIQLRIIGERARIIGNVSHVTHTLILKRKVATHRYRKLDAYGMNAELVRNSRVFGFDRVLMHLDNGREFIFPVEYALEKGEYLNFKRVGYELQLFMRMSDLVEYERNR